MAHQRIQASQPFRYIDIDPHELGSSSKLHVLVLVEADNVDQAVEAVYKLYNDNILREKVIKNGSMRVNAFFNVSRVANEHERLIVKLCEQGDKK